VRWNRSLRLRLTLAVIFATAPLMAGFAGLLYRIVADAVWESFDRQLLDDALVLASLVEQEPEGYEIELEGLASRLEADPGAVTRYQIWAPDGTPLLPAQADLSPAEGSAEVPARWEGTWADGTPARRVAFTFLPHLDQEEAVDPATVRPLSIALARDSRRETGLLADLAAWFWTLGTGMVLVSSGVAGLAIARSLRPMRAVSEALTAVDAEHLDRTLPVEDVPLELRPLVDRVNGLLAQLDQAFAREKRFSADVAHELRTPLAVLRASVELAQSDRDATMVAGRLSSMLAAIDQTRRLVDDLIDLARAEGQAADPARREDVDLGDLVEREWRVLEPAARARGLELRNEIAPASYVLADPAKLRRIVGNLLSNAVAYTETGGWVQVRSAPERGVLVEVRDSGPPIPAEALPHLFERFWRADQARTATGAHAGLGLGLARALARRMGRDIEAHNEGSTACFTVR
jgi:signal transduction histidine kinase